LKNYVEHVQTPFWLSPTLAYLAFIPLNPQYTDAFPFQDLAFIPNQFSNSPEGKRMPPAMQSKWEKLEDALKKSARALLSRLNVQGDPPPLPSTLGYMSAHLLLRHLRTALQTSRESYSLWIGALAFAIALSQFMEPQLENSAIPRWHSALREAGLNEVWVDGLRTSPMMRFDGSALRVGVVLDILSPQKIQASVDWLCNFNVPVWYPWGPPEATASTSNPNIARLAPHTHQLQNASSFFTKEVRDTYQEIQQHNSQPNANKRTFEGMDDEVRVSKRPRQEPQASNEPDPWGTSSSAITWTTDKPNPWGNGNWPVLPDPPSNHTTTSDSGLERPIPQPQPNLTKNVASYEPFFALRKERNQRLMKSERPKEKQQRENRERVPPTNKTFLFEWKKNDDNLYTRVRVTKSEYEDCFDRHGRHRRRYDAFSNEWDMCKDFGPPEKRQIAENSEDEDEDYDLPRVAAARGPTSLSQTANLIPTTPNLETQATNFNGRPGSHISQTTDRTPTPVPETSSKMSVVDVPPSQPGPKAPILSQLHFSVVDQGTPVENVGPLQSTGIVDALPAMSAAPDALPTISAPPDALPTVSATLVALPAISATPQVDSLLPFPGVKDQIDISQNEGLAGIRQVPDSDFSWPISSSIEALVTGSEETSGCELQEELGDVRFQVPESDFSWPTSSSLMALVTASEGPQRLETYNITSILHSVYGFISPNSASRQPTAAIIDGPNKKKLQVSAGLNEDEAAFLQSPLAPPALEFLDRLADAQLSPGAELSDLAEGSLEPLRDAERLRQLSLVGSLYVFNFKTDATLPWMIGVSSAAIALYIVRLDPRLNDYEISRHLLRCGIAFHTVLPLVKIPKSRIPHVDFSSIRSAGHIFTLDDFNAYVIYRDSLLRSPRGRAALLKGGIVWRLAMETVSVNECLEGPSFEALVHRRGLVHPTANPTVDLCDDDLSIAELDLICGVYECFTGKVTVFQWLSIVVKKFQVILVKQASNHGFHFTILGQQLHLSISGRTVAVLSLNVE